MGRVRHIAVWLVRAGPTVWEDEGRLVGSADIPLGEAGVAAARERALALTGQSVAAIISGPGEACTGTAHAVAEVTGDKVKVIDELGDPSLGLWEGMREADLEDRWPTVYRQWKEDPFTVSVPNGEPMDDAKERMVEVLRKLLPKYASADGAIVVVLRPTAIGMARCYFEGYETTKLWEVAAEGSGVQRLTLDADRLRERLGLPAVGRAVAVPLGTVPHAAEIKADRKKTVRK